MPFSALSVCSVGRSAVDGNCRSREGWNRVGRLPKGSRSHSVPCQQLQPGQKLRHDKPRLRPLIGRGIRNCCPHTHTGELEGVTRVVALCNRQTPRTLALAKLHNCRLFRRQAAFGKEGKRSESKASSTSSPKYRCVIVSACCYLGWLGPRDPGFSVAN